MNLFLSFALIFGGIIFQVFIPGFPKEFLLIQAGLVFGFFLGGLINWFAMIIAAQVGYEVVRRSIERGSNFNNLLIQYQNSKIIHKLNEKGNFGLFTIRLLPFAPNDVLSLISGALLLPRKGYFLVSVITALPYAFFFAYLGSIGSNYYNKTKLIQINFLLILVSFLIIVIKRSRNVKMQSEGA